MERPRGVEERYRADYYADRPIPNLVVPAILILLFCCQVGGIIALVYAVQANAAKQMGNYHSAARAAQAAKSWINISLLLGVLLVVVFLALALLGGGR